jgi:hypothetical protein
MKKRISFLARTTVCALFLLAFGVTSPALADGAPDDSGVHVLHEVTTPGAAPLSAMMEGIELGAILLVTSLVGLHEVLRRRRPVQE